MLLLCGIGKVSKKRRAKLRKNLSLLPLLRFLAFSSAMSGERFFFVRSPFVASSAIIIVCHGTVTTSAYFHSCLPTRGERGGGRRAPGEQFVGGSI